MRQFGDNHNCCGFSNIEGYGAGNPCNATADVGKTEFCYFDFLKDGFSDCLRKDAIGSIQGRTFQRKHAWEANIKNWFNSGAILKELNTFVATKVVDGNVYYRRMTKEEIIKKWS
jgi:hypothetical protein